MGIQANVDAKGPKWTEAGLKAIAASGKREVFHHPTIPGFVLLVTPSGVKTFYLIYRFPRGRAGVKKWFKLGVYPIDGSLKRTAERVVVLRGEIQAGADPQGTRTTARTKATTMNELCDRFVAEYVEKGKVKVSTGKFYARYIDAHVRPRLGKMEVQAVTGDHVAKLLDEVSAGNRPKLKSVLSRLFSRAHLWHLRPGLENPVLGQDGGETKRREVRLTTDQLSALGDHFATWKGPWQVPAMVRLLVLTGMRLGELVGSAKGEIQQRPWRTVRLDEGVIVLAPEDHKTGKKTGEKTIYLCREAVALLKTFPRENEWVLSGWMNPQDAYRDLRLAVPELVGTRLHDLRHTFISTGDDLGVTPATVAALVGHSAKTQTGRYTHKFDADLANAAQVIGGHLAGLLGLPLFPRSKSPIKTPY